MSLFSSLFGRSQPFIDLPTLGAGVTALRKLYGDEAETSACDELSTATDFVFRQYGYEINATFCDEILERVFFVPNNDSGFTRRQLKLMSDFYGQGKAWVKIADTDYMTMFRRDDDMAYFIFNGIAQFKTERFDYLRKEARGS